MVHIAALIMVKNEKKRLHVTLESIKNFADSLVIFDTGSTDNTIQICKDFSQQNKIPLRLKEGTFVNFEVSRNESINFAETFDDIDYILLMDTNDELRNGNLLRNILEKNSKFKAFMICQEWWSGVADKYYNVRVIKSRENWRYIGAVHEYITRSSPENDDDKYLARLDDSIILYQDRTKDDDKSSKRFHRDKVLLMEEYIKNPTNPRTVFYLAQTYLCLDNYEDAYYYYKIRSEMDGFNEEKYYSYYKCGNLTEKLNHDWYDCMAWYLKAYNCIKRAEPLISIAEYYYKNNKWDMAYTFINLACKLDYPSDCILFVDRLSYDYKRWHLMGIIAYYNKSYKKGKDALYKAIESGKKNNLNIDLDKSNLKFYFEKEMENKEKDIQPSNQRVANNNETVSENSTNRDKLINIIKSKQNKRLNK